MHNGVATASPGGESGSDGFSKAEEESDEDDEKGAFLSRREYYFDKQTGLKLRRTEQIERRV